MSTRDLARTSLILERSFPSTYFSWRVDKLKEMIVYLKV